jgi:flagellar basal-body rod modification protein FlgD
MQVNSATQAPAYQGTATSATSSTGSTTNSTSSASGLADPNLFISLLTAQLQAQDPLNPMSPEDMVTQLTQVSSLQQLININQTLTSLSQSGSTTAPASTAPAATS